MKLKRITRRKVAVAIGLCLGWYMASLAEYHLPFVATSIAENLPPHGSREPAAHGGGKHGEEGNVSDNLRPGSKPAWLNDVLNITGGLFVAAIVLGPIALALRGAERPDPTG